MAPRDDASHAALCRLPALVAVAITACVGVVAERHVAVGSAHVCTVVTGGDIACFGDGAGNRTAVPAYRYGFHGVTVGDAYSCGLAVNGSMVCWGVLAGRLDGANAGATFVPVDAATGTPARFIDIHGGRAHVCGLAAAGSVACYGDGSTGATAVPQGVVFQGVSAGANYTCGVTRDKRVMCWGDAAHPVVAAAAAWQSITDAEHVAAGTLHACYVRVGGGVTCWGVSNGSAPPPEVSAAGAPVWWLTAGLNVTCALTGTSAPGDVACWGDASSGAAFPPPTPTAYEMACSALGCFAVVPLTSNAPGAPWTIVAQRATTPSVGAAPVTLEAHVVTTVAATLGNLIGIAVDSASRDVAFAAPTTQRIQIAAADGTIVQLAGNGLTGFADGDDVDAMFFNPLGVALTANGDVLVTDSANNRIRRVTRLGHATTLAGSGAAASADGVGTNAAFDMPSGIAVGGGGEAYVTDRGSHRLRVVTPAGVVTTLAGSSQGFADGVGSVAQFSAPQGVAVWRATGVVYVADGLNGCIRAVTPTGAVTSTVCGFRGAAAVAVDRMGGLYILETYGYNLSYAAAGAHSAVTLAGGAASGIIDGVGTAARFNFPRGIAIGDDGVLYIGDTQNNAIRKVTPLLPGGIYLGVAVPTTIAPNDAVTPWRAIALNTTTPGVADLRGAVFSAPLAAPHTAGMNPLVSTLQLGTVTLAPRLASPTPADTNATFSSSARAALRTVELSVAELPANGLVAEGLQTLTLTLPDGATRLRLDRHSFTGLPSLECVNGDGNTGWFVLAGLSCYSEQPGVLALDVLSGLATAPAIHIVDLTDNGIEQLVPATGDWEAPSVLVLSLCAGNTAVPAALTQAAPFAAFPSLRSLSGTIWDAASLHLSDCAITALHPAALGGLDLTGVSTVDLTNNAIAAAGDVIPALLPLMAPITANVYLELAQNGLTSVGAHDFDGAYGLWRLTLAGNNIGFIAESAFTSIKHPVLANIDEGGNPLQTAACAPGYYNDLRVLGGGARTLVCVPCAVGTYCTGNTAATLCAPGTYGTGVGAVSAATCSLCPAGTFNDQPGQARISCLMCPVGTASRERGANTSDACVMCPPGTYAGSPGNAECTPCGAGTYSDAVGAPSALTCMLCPADTYSEALGAASAATCSPCPPGSNTVVSGAASAAACVVAACPPGAVRDESGTCRPCPSGTFAHNSECTPCPAGRFSGAPGAGACTPCPPGTYRGTTGGNSSASCAACPMGTVCMPSGTACLAICPAGTLLTAPPASAALQAITSQCGAPAAGDVAAVCSTCSPSAVTACLPGVMSPIALLSAVLPPVPSSLAASGSEDNATADVQLALVAGGGNTFGSCGAYTNDHFLVRPAAAFTAVRQPILIATGVGALVVLMALWRHAQPLAAGADGGGEPTGLRAVLTKLDNFSSVHAVPRGEVVRNAPPPLGGAFTAAFLVAAVGLSLSVLVQLGTAAYLLTQSVIVTPAAAAGGVVAGVHTGPVAVSVLLLGDASDSTGCDAVRMVPPATADPAHAWGALRASRVPLSDAMVRATYGLPATLADGGVAFGCEVSVACTACALARGAFSLTLAAPATYQSAVLAVSTRAAYPGCAPTFLHAVGAPAADRLLERVALDIQVNPVAFVYTGTAARGSVADGTGHDVQLANAAVSLRSDATILRPDLDALTLALTFTPTPYTTMIAVADALEPLTIVFSVVGMVSGLGGAFRLLVKRYDALVLARRARAAAASAASVPSKGPLGRHDTGGSSSGRGAADTSIMMVNPMSRGGDKPM